MSTLEYHVLLAMAAGPLYGYAIKQAVEEESAGGVVPRAGSLYRVLSRLMSQGLVREAESPEGSISHPGRERKYYALTGDGRGALAEETSRLEAAATLARQRLEVAGGHA